MADPAQGGPSGYDYFRPCGQNPRKDRQIKQALALGRARCDPALTEPDYLILRQRVRILTEAVQALPQRELLVLDVGGRIQPYRPLLEGRIDQYLAIDRQLHGLVDVVAVGEQLPCATDQYDVVLCTQVLSYAADPFAFATELHRVLKSGGTLLLTVPAWFPRHHDERWRFLPEGLQLLFSAFRKVRIVPEGHSLAGICRTVNVGLDTAFDNYRLRRLVSHTLIRFFNLVGRSLDGLSRGNTMFTANYTVIARK